jgi:hypothetical protein
LRSCQARRHHRRRRDRQRWKNATESERVVKESGAADEI